MPIWLHLIQKHSTFKNIYIYYHKLLMVLHAPSNLHFQFWIGLGGTEYAWEVALILLGLPRASVTIYFFCLMQRYFLVACYVDDDAKLIWLANLNISHNPSSTTYANYYNCKTRHTRSVYTLGILTIEALKKFWHASAPKMEIQSILLETI